MENLEIVFVYGTLRRGFHNHHLIQDSTFLGCGNSQQRYLMTHSGIPYLCRRGGPWCATGELYAVDGKTFERLDRLEGHPNFYRREKIAVESDEGVVQAWCYFCDMPDMPKVPYGDYAMVGRGRV